MPRIFTTARDLDYFSHIGKELTKDVIGTKIFYFSISVVKTKIDLYEESIDKVYEDPIEIECWVKWMEPEVVSGKFGIEYKSKIECSMQSRDMIDKEIELKSGDYFSFGSLIYEVLSVVPESIIHGQVEYVNGLKITGLQSRKSQFSAKVFGPTNEKYSDPDAVQDTFVQQRGLSENRLGPTNDKRAVLEDNVIEKSLGVAEVSQKGRTDNSSRSSFYGDEE